MYHHKNRHEENKKGVVEINNTRVVEVKERKRVYDDDVYDNRRQYDNRNAGY